MNAAITYDYIKRLENVGFSQAQAEVLVALKTEIPDNVATKQELIQLDQDLTQKIEQSESRLESVIKDLKIEMMQEFHAMRTEMHEFRAETKSEFVTVKSDILLLKGVGAFVMAFITILASTAGAFDFLKQLHF